jgi:Carboxypeptidase regulatory-like domain
MPRNDYSIRMRFMRLAILLLLSSFAAAQCDDGAWIIADDGIAGVVSKEGKPVKHATVHLSSSDREFSAVTDGEGRFSIWPVPVGKYSFAVKGWGERHLEVKGWQRGKINRAGLLFSKHKNCLLLVLVSN